MYAPPLCLAQAAQHWFLKGDEMLDEYKKLMAETQTVLEMYVAANIETDCSELMQGFARLTKAYWQAEEGKPDDQFEDEGAEQAKMEHYAQLYAMAVTNQIDLIQKYTVLHKLYAKVGGANINV